LAKTSSVPFPPREQLHIGLVPFSSPVEGMIPMACRCRETQDWDDDDCGDDREACGCESGDSSETDDATMPCPYCGETIYDDAPQCPHCGQYILADDIRSQRQPWWIIIGVLLCIGAVLVWIMVF
jgi:hypothetical protein